MILLHRTSECQYFLRNFNDFASPGQPSPAQPSPAQPASPRANVSFGSSSAAYRLSSSEHVPSTNRLYCFNRGFSFLQIRQREANKNLFGVMR